MLRFLQIGNLLVDKALIIQRLKHVCGEKTLEGARSIWSMKRREKRGLV